MLMIAIVFLVAGILVLTIQPRWSRPSSSRPWRVDSIAISTVLFLLSACMIVLELGDLVAVR